MSLIVNTTSDARARLHALPGTVKGYILAFAAMASVSLNYVTAKYALRVYPTEVFVPLWFGAATVYAFAYLALRHKPTPWHQVTRYWKAFAWVSGVTAVSAAAGFWGLHITDPTVASLISRMAVPAAILMGIVFLGERPTPREVAGIVTCVVGLFVIVCRGGSVQQLLGPGMLLLSAILYALSQMFVRQVANDVEPTLMAGMRTFGAAMLVLVIAFAAGRLQVPWAPRHLLVLVVGAFFGPFLAHVLLFKSLAYLELSRAGTAQASQPIFVAIYAWTFLRMLPGLQQIIGGLIIIAGLLIILSGARAYTVPDGQAGG